MTDEPLRAASVGIGRWSDVVASAVQRSSRIKIVSCYSRTPEKRVAFANKYNCLQAGSYEDLLADPEIDAILVTTPNPAHAETIEKAAQAGKHVWVEKPIAHTMKDARRIAEAVKQAGVTFSVGHSARMLGASRKIKELIDQDDVGQVALVEANWSNERALELTPNKWRFFRENTPGGPLIQLLVHHFDTLQYIFGPIQEVQAYTRRLYTAAEVDDVAVVVVQFNSGHLGYIGSSWVSPGIYWMNVYGTKANLYHELDFQRWRDKDVDQYTSLSRQPHGTNDRTPVAVPIKDMFRDELEDFADSVRNKRKPEVGAEEAMRALAVVEAAVCSSESRRPVAISEVL